MVRFVHGARHPRVGRLDRGDRAVRAVGHGVERRHVAALGRGQPQQQLPPPAGPALAPSTPATTSVMSPTTSSPSPSAATSTNVGDRLRVERGVPARDHHRMLDGAVGRVQRDAGEVERGEQVRVAQLGGEADAQQVERAQRPVAVDGEGGHPVLAHQRLEIRPDRVAALGQGVGALVEDLVEDLTPWLGSPTSYASGYISAHRTAADSQSLSCAFSSPPTYCTGLDTRGQQRLESGENGRSGHADPG